MLQRITQLHLPSDKRGIEGTVALLYILAAIVVMLLAYMIYASITKRIMVGGV